MFCNATTTVYRHGRGYDECGNPFEGPQEILCENTPAVFSQGGFAGRVTHSSGMFEYTAPRYRMMLHCCKDTKIRVGDWAEVTNCDGQVETFKIEDAVYTCGISESHWEFALEKTKSPMKTNASCCV